jgi:hypothetical protein
MCSLSEIFRKSKTADGPRSCESLVERRDALNYFESAEDRSICTEVNRERLRSQNSLESLLLAGNFWFFQRRESFVRQSRLMRWDPNRLDAYVLLPLNSGFVNKKDCMFIIHYWRTHGHPDPNGEDLRATSNNLRLENWSYIWVDWPCMPQGPNRSQEQGKYFKKMLRFIPTLLRECGTTWNYPSFEPRAWILFELAVYWLCNRHRVYKIHNDQSNFWAHLCEMLREGVSTVISRHRYRCTNSTNMTLVTGWLELLLILYRLIPDVYNLRTAMQSVEMHEAGSVRFYDVQTITIDKIEGIVSCEGSGTQYRFTPVYQYA